MDLIKSITIDSLPLSFHSIKTMEVDFERAVVNLRVLSWFSQEAKESGSPPHRAHILTSLGDPTELGAVLLRALAEGALAGAEILPPPSSEAEGEAPPAG